MNGIKITEELPENGSIVYAKMEGSPELLCKFKNDSFGLGDDDFKIISWRYAIPVLVTNLKPLYCSPRSILHTEDRKVVYSSR